MSRLKSNIIYLGLDYKKEILKIVLYNLLIVTIIALSFIFIKQIFIQIFIVLGGVIIDYVVLTSYSSKRKTLLAERNNELIKLISYFKIFIANNNNVYHSLECLIPFSNEWMKGEIQNLLKDMDVDKSILPFKRFASSFESKHIDNVMTSIYQMIEEENNMRLERFSRIFSEIEKEHRQVTIEQRTHSLDLMNNFPLFGAGFISIILTIGVMNIIGGMINGL